MNLWIFECQKLWKNKLVCGLILGCFFLNVLFLWHKTGSYDVNRRCFPNTVKEVYEKLEGMSEQKQIIWLEHELVGGWETADSLGEVQSAEAVFRRNAQKYVLENIRTANQYEEYLKNIEKQARLISGSSLFAEKNLFSRKNAELIPRKYQGLHGIKLKAENPQAVLLATESEITDLCLMVMIILLVYFCICMEREEGTMAFARCTRYGTEKLGTAKVGMILVGSVVSVLVLYGSNMILAGFIYGFGDLGRWIQSVEGYTASPWKISVGEYLVLYLSGKLAAAAVVSGVVTCIALFGKSILRTSVILLGIGAGEYALYTAVPPHSWMDICRQCNLFYFIKTQKFFQSYETINLFEYPVSSMHVCCFAGVLVIFATVWISVSSYERVSKSEYTGERKNYFTVRRKDKSHSLLHYEGYKILWTGGAGILMVVFLFFQFLICSGEQVSFTLDELYYKNYIRQLEGEVTGEKLAFIKEEGHRIAALEDRLYELERNMESISTDEMREKKICLEQQLSGKMAYEKVKAQMERIGRDGVFLDEEGYAYLLDRKQQAYQIGKLLLLWILAFHTAFIVEEAAGMSVIWNTVPGGRKKIYRRKWIILIAGIVLLCTVSDGIFIAFRMKAQGLFSLGYAVRCLPGFEVWGDLTVGGYLLILCIFKIILGVLCCGIICMISGKSKNATTVLLASGSLAGIFYLLLRASV